MSKVDLWARIEAATERAEDMAKAERVLARVRRAPHTIPAPEYIDEDGPEIVTTKALGNWIGWPEKKGVRR